MTITKEVLYQGNQYEVDAEGNCFVIKTRRGCNGRILGTYKSKITSERKIKVLCKLAADRSIPALGGAFPAQWNDDDEPNYKPGTGNC